MSLAIRTFLAFALALLLALPAGNPAAQTTGIITTVAGTGEEGFGGEGGPATGAQLNGPEFIALDSSGNLFIADRDNHRIRRVAAGSGVITTVAGTGMAGFAGDDGPATRAQLNVPIGVALDPSGNLFIADFSNHRIRRIAAETGLVTTVAGTGTAGSAGDGGAATSAQLNLPTGVALDLTGNLFIADYFNHRVRRVAAGTGVIATVAGTGMAGFGGDGGPATRAQLKEPTGVALDGSGNLFITEFRNHRIRRVAAETGLVTTVAGTGMAGFAGDGGAATSAQLSSPIGVALDASGNLFIADSDNHRIRRVAGVAAPACPDTPSPVGSSLTISQARGRAGDMITFSISGTAGETAAVAYSRSNSGGSYRGLSLLLGTELGVVVTCALSGGACSQSVTIPAGLSGTFFFQAGRSSDPAFRSGTFSVTNGTCLTIQ